VWESVPLRNVCSPLHSMIGQLINSVKLGLELMHEWKKIPLNRIQCKNGQQGTWTKRLKGPMDKNYKKKEY